MYFFVISDTINSYIYIYIKRIYFSFSLSCQENSNHDFYRLTKELQNFLIKLFVKNAALICFLIMSHLKLQSAKSSAGSVALIFVFWSAERIIKFCHINRSKTLAINLNFTEPSNC